MILGICDRFHCLPSQAIDEDAGIIRLMKIQELSQPVNAGGGEQEW